MINPYGIPQPDFSGVQSLAPQQAPINIDVPKIKRGGMFANADWGSAISAALNGYLAAGGNPAGVAGLQQLHQQKMLEQQKSIEAQQYAQHRADDNADWMSHYNYELTNPKPQAPSDFEQTLIESGVKPGTPEWTQAMKTRANNLLDPAVMTPQGLMLRSQVTGALAPQPAPPGVTFTPLDNGGPTPPASGGFLGNNPGALRVPGSMQFQRFRSPQEGVAAQEAQLARYMTGKFNGTPLRTVRDIVETYAPRQSHGGDNTDEQVNNYITYVSRRLGVSPDQPVANVSQLGRAMREFETGKRVD